MVGDDVEEDLDAAGVRRVDQPLELGVGREVRVHPGEVGDPVAVVAGRGVLARALDGAVLERRGQPDRGRAEALDVVEAVEDPRDVAAVVEALVGRVEPVVEAAALDAAGVVAGVAVGEPVGHHEVEALAGRRSAQRVGGERAVRVGDLVGGQLGRCHRHPVGVRVVAEPEVGGVLEVEPDVGGAVGSPAVALVPAAVEGDLVGVAAGRDGERAGPRAVLAAGETGGRAAGRPVGLAAELGLQRPDQGHRLRRCGVVGRGRGGPEERDEQGGDGERCEGAQHKGLFQSRGGVTADTVGGFARRGQVLQDLSRRPRGAGPVSCTAGPGGGCPSTLSAPVAGG